MAGFWSRVPSTGQLITVTAQELWNDLVAYSDQTTITGWQARDSYFRFRDFAMQKFAAQGSTLTWEQLYLYYVSDPTMNLGIVASTVELNTQTLKQPRYARMTYVLDPTTGWITDFGVHLFSRWPFYSVNVANPAPAQASV